MAGLRQATNWLAGIDLDNAEAIVTVSPAPSAVADFERAARRTLWALRVAWFALAPTLGAAIGQALAGRSTPVAAVGQVLAAVVWLAGLIATYVPHPIGLTVLRIAAPGAVASAIVAVATAKPTALTAVAAVVVSFAAAALALQGDTADRCVHGASYGPERRLALRIPTALLVGPLPLAWLAVAGGITVGPMLLAARNWWLGLPVTVVGLTAAAFGVRSIHGLTNRFVVFVPAGFVLHDRAALLEPVLFTRDVIASLGPAPAGSTATDLTLGATGLILEANLHGRLDIPRRTGRNDAEMISTDAVLFSVLRPGHLLAIAAEHRIAVG